MKLIKISSDLSDISKLKISLVSSVIGVLFCLLLIFNGYIVVSLIGLIWIGVYLYYLSRLSEVYLSEDKIYVKTLFSKNYEISSQNFNEENKFFRNLHYIKLNDNTRIFYNVTLKRGLENAFVPYEKFLIYKDFLNYIKSSV